MTTCHVTYTVLAGEFVQLPKGSNGVSGSISSSEYFRSLRRYHNKSKMSRRGKRATKVQSAFKDFVSPDVQERPMLEEGKSILALKSD